MILYQQLSPRKTTALLSSFAIICLVLLSHFHPPASTQESTSGSRWSTPIFPQAANHSHQAFVQGHDLLDNVSNATLGFQNFFVINLPSRTDRRDSSALAAALTGIDVDYIEAVTDVDPKAWIAGGKDVGMNSGSAGAVRSHLNVLRTIVERDIASAIILEDDVDWDVRIKSQMHDFARASRLLVQPLPNSTNQFLDPTWPQPDENHQEPVDIDMGSASTCEPTTSPYGDLDRWDILWLGHCGCRFPSAEDKNVPLGRAMIANDETVPARHLYNVELGDSQILHQYPDHTRIVSRARMNSCALAYAVSQAGARKLLYELGVHKVDGTFDMMLRSVCHGSDGRELAVCLTPQPALFNHHRPVGVRSSFSNIGDFVDPDGWNAEAKSENIRWAARVNLLKLIQGETDYIDSYREE